MDKFMRKFMFGINIAEYAFFVLATIFVLVFQFVGHPIFVSIALACYTFAFMLVAITAFTQCMELFEATKNAKLANSNVKTENGEEVVNTKKEKIWSIVKTCLGTIFAIFTFVVLILY